MKRNFTWILGIFFLLCSCAKEEIVEKYDNGEAKLVHYYKEENGKKIKVKEIRYYDNKQKRLEGEFDKEGNNLEF